MEESVVPPPPPQKDKLRIEFIHRPTKRRWLKFRKYPFPVQNVPFEFGFKITNISKKPFGGAEVSNVILNFKNSGFEYCSDEVPHIRALNPSESFDLYFDKNTSLEEGPVWVKCTLKPTTKNSIIHTYQHDKNHNSDGKYEGTNSWGDSTFIQGKLELLQTNTNFQILALTIVTVLEAVFGLKNILQALFGAISQLFSLLSKFFGYFS